MGGVREPVDFKAGSGQIADNAVYWHLRINYQLLL